MILVVTVKSMGRRNKGLIRKELQLSVKPGTLRELISEVVSLQVQQLKEKQQDNWFIPYLTQAEIQAQGEMGKVGFGAVDSERAPDVEEAVDAALLAFEDGLYKVFIREEAASDLDEPLILEDRNEIAFIRLTMLAGSFW